MAHPLLRRWADWYLSKPRVYTYKGLKVQLYPSVFHPGILLSTHILLEFVEKALHPGDTVLELGCGSGLIALMAARRGATVTASDVNPAAVRALKESASLNNLDIDVIQSDLFDQIPPTKFDYILINPPYYPKDPKNDKERAFFCGLHFEYFEKLFEQLPEFINEYTRVYMILSEDCDIGQIVKRANQNRLSMEKVHRLKRVGEWNFIFRIVPAGDKVLQ